MKTSQSVKVGRAAGGLVARVEGRGTMHESPGLHELAIHSLRDDDTATLTIDLSACEYLDSTFLGCLVDLHKTFGMSRPPRVLVAAATPSCRRILASSRLDTLLVMTDEVPEVVGELVTIPTSGVESGRLGRHLLQCHERLCELGDVNERIYRPIADKIARELEH